MNYKSHRYFLKKSYSIFLYQIIYQSLNLKITEIKKLKIEEIPIDNYMYDLENIKLFYVF